MASTKKRALGRGLNALMADVPEDDNKESAEFRF